MSELKEGNPFPATAEHAPCYRNWPAIFSKSNSCLAKCKKKHRKMPPPLHPVITLLYATVSRNAEQLALVSRDRLRGAGCDVALYNVADFPAARLAEVDTALIFTTTWGAGAPPPDAVEFFHALDRLRLNLDHLAFAVFENGARSNGNSCGRRIDAALHARGAIRLMLPLEGGLRSFAPFEAWFAEVQRELISLRVNECFSARRLAVG